MTIKDNEYSERRQCKRFRISYPTTLITNNKNISASTFNISESGIGIELNKKLKKNNYIKYKIQIDSDDFKQNIDTKVIWCSYISDGKYKAGLEIIK